LTRRRRGGTLVFVSALAVGTGAAFATGAHLKEQLPKSDTARASASQVAQATARAEHGTAGIPTLASPFGGKKGEESQAGLSTFETVYQLVEQNYVDKLPSEQKLSQGAVKGMLATLNDPNSQFLDTEQHQLLVGESEGKYSGIGASLYIKSLKRDGYTEYKIVVVSPAPGSPAEKAGLKPGDVITHVDGKWVLGYDPFLKFTKLAKQIQDRDSDADEDAARKELEAAKKKALGGITLMGAFLTLRGDQKILKTLKLKDDSRSLTVERAGVKEPIKVTLTPGVTEVAEPVTTKTLDGGVGYIKVALFTSKTGEAFKTALAAVPTDKGLVIDLRDNPGGLLEPAQQIAGALLPTGSLGFEVSTGGKSTALKTIAATGAKAPAKTVVLVDAGTASTAELLAASLADQNAATLVGGPTFGDAYVQKLFPLGDGSAFTLTTGKFLSPNRTDWQAKGLAPRVTVAANASDEQFIGKALDVLKNSGKLAATPAQVR
jgi:carboxyl-terminal processing protease